MKLIKQKDGKTYVISAKEVEDISSLKNNTSNEILKLISLKPMYPKEIARKLLLHEQNVYYYIRKLELAKIIEIERTVNINGTTANYYKPSSQAFCFIAGNFKESSKEFVKESDFLKPFILNGEMNSIIVVGSPDPHGPQKARSKDGYFGMDLALFLGSFLTCINDSKIKLDTEITQEQVKGNNLIVIGGPIVNKVSSMLNEHMNIYYDEDKKGVYSKITKKTYFSDEIGYINKFENPFNKEKNILLISGLRNTGTKSAILAFLKHFSELKSGNKFKKNINSRIVEGIDLNSDGIVDDVEFLE